MSGALGTLCAPAQGRQSPLEPAQLWQWRVEGLVEARCARGLGKAPEAGGGGSPLQVLPGPGVFRNSSSEAWGSDIGACPWFPGPYPHLPLVWVQVGSTARG